MAKRKTWKDKLTKAELKHLKETAEVTTLAQLEYNFEEQAEMRRINPRVEPCWECKAIAVKLGYEV